MMEQLRVQFELNEEQRKIIDDLFNRDGECMCGQILNGGSRALIAQPNSSKSSKPGQFIARAFCRECFDVMQDAFRWLKDKRKKK